jgi:hypothetical protein
MYRNFYQKINNKAADSNTGNETPHNCSHKESPNGQRQSSHRHTLGSKVNNRHYIVKDPIKEEAINIAIEINHKVIPIPDPGIACGNADNDK